MANPAFLRSISRWRRVKWASLMIVSLSIFLGLLYPILADGFSNFYRIANGLIIGFIGGVLISVLELHVFYEPNRRKSFLNLVLIKVIVYSIAFTFLLIFIVLLSRSVEYGRTPIETFYSEEFHSFLFKEDFGLLVGYTMAFVFVVIFVKEIGRKIGVRVLLNFISGKYHRPIEEKKIFMFIDLDNSTTIAEEIDDLKYHMFINQFFKDITEGILFVQGEIYQYVGDEIVISWPLKKGLKDSNCVYTYFYCKQIINSLTSKYQKEFGVIPTFKASLHVGTVIRGEVGDVKSEIVYHGDTVNTTARIERLCSKLKEPFLISKDIWDYLPNYITKQFKLKGSYKLKGKEKEIQIFGLNDKSKNYLDSKVA